jgi:hypothetical protein
MTEFTTDLRRAMRRLLATPLFTTFAVCLFDRASMFVYLPLTQRYDPLLTIAVALHSRGFGGGRRGS